MGDTGRYRGDITSAASVRLASMPSAVSWLRLGLGLGLTSRTPRRSYIPNYISPTSHREVRGAHARREQALEEARAWLGLRLGLGLGLGLELGLGLGFWIWG